MTQLQKKEIDIEDIQEENSPLKTEEIISILNKTTNSKFLKSDEIIANIALNFKKFSGVLIKCFNQNILDFWTYG